MRLLDDMCARLIAAASSNEWQAAEEPQLIARQFRGRTGEADVRLPSSARGLMLGCYPVLIAELRLAPEDDLAADVRAAHNQMIIARSYLLSSQVVDAHIFFVTVEPPPATDWKQQIDSVERDETVCRKLVWMPNPRSLDASFEDFLQRTFLARPWRSAEQRSDAPLDENEQLVETVLQEKGLSAEAAIAWVDLVNRKIDDPDQLVEQLVSAMESKP